MALRPTGAAIYLKNLDTGREEVLGHFPDMTMTMAPRFSPDDSKVAFAVEKGGSGQHLCDGPAPTTPPQRLTTDLAIDTSPSFSPDGAPDRVQLRPRRLARSSM